MPAAPRPSKKGTKIRDAILGKPSNMQKNKKRTNRKKLLNVEETNLLR